MTTDGEITSKEGAGVSTSLTDQMHDDWVLQAENFVNCFIRINYSDTYSGLSVDVKYIFSDIVSSLVAINGILYDTGGYNSRSEAETKITMLRDGINRALGVLRDKKFTDFIDGAS